MTGRAAGAGAESDAAEPDTAEPHAADLPVAEPDPERRRLEDAREGRVAWYRWGPYLADRHWGTVREDYSANGDAWNYLPHGHARSRAYRWGEDGLLGISDQHSRLCFSIALWNERDPILKERLFGLSGPEGNHGEDVKESYFYIDATPTASYLRALYKYPQGAFPYAELVVENARRGKEDPEYELSDTGVFDDARYFDVEVEYAKATQDDIAIRISVTNRGPDPAPIHLLPTLWFRNTWSWGTDDRRPSIMPRADETLPAQTATRAILRAEHHTLGTAWLTAAGDPELLFTENESNAERLWGVPSRTAAVKDAFHDAIVDGDATRLAPPSDGGTKAAAHHDWTLAPGRTRIADLRLARREAPASPTGGHDALNATRRAEADTFYASVTPAGLSDDERLVQR